MKIKVWLIVAVALVSVAALLLSACTPAATTVTTTTATTATTTATATTTTTATTTVKPITLKFNYDMPLKVGPAIAWHKWADGVTKETNGKVLFEFYPAATLFDIFTARDSIKARIADIACISEAVDIRSFPIFEMTEYPGLGFGNTEAAITGSADAKEKIIAKFPEIQAEFKDWKVLFHSGGSGSIIASTVPVHVPADFKGKKVGDTGVVTQLIKDLNAAPVQLSPPDYYMNLKTGVVDIVLTDWSEINIFKLWEVAPYFYDYGIGGQAGLTVIMNWDSWNAIPADAQAVMTKLAAPSFQGRDAALVQMEDIIAGKQGATDKGCTIANATKDEIAAWDKVMEPLWSVWVNEMKADGVTDAQEILDYWRSLQAQYR